MRRSRAAGLAVAVYGVLAFFASAVHAEGPGIRLGDRLVLHPGIGVEFRYDTNVFFQPPGSETGAFLLRVLPSLDLATRPGVRGGGAPHAIDFRFHAGADYNEFLTGDSTISRHRAIGVQAGALLTILPSYPFSIDLFDNYIRLVQAPFSPSHLDNISRDTNEVGVRFRYRPGGGRLELDLSYAFGVDFFEETQFTDLNVFYHKIELRASWKFLPKTAVWIDVSETPYTYLNQGPGTLQHPNSYPLRVDAGLSGLITTKLSLNVWIGYGNGFYQPIASQPVTAANPNSVIAGLSLTWKPTVLSTGTLGYRHDFANSVLGSYYDVDQVYIGWSQLIWRFTGSFRLAYSNIRYQGIEAATGLVDAANNPLTSRTDNYLNLDVRVDYPFRDWLIASLGYTLQYNNTAAHLAASAPNAIPLPLDYLKNEVWLRLSVLY